MGMPVVLFRTPQMLLAVLVLAVVVNCRLGTAPTPEVATQPLPSVMSTAVASTPTATPFGQVVVVPQGEFASCVSPNTPAPTRSPWPTLSMASGPNGTVVVSGTGLPARRAVRVLVAFRTPEPIDGFGATASTTVDGALAASIFVRPQPADACFVLTVEFEEKRSGFGGAAVRTYFIRPAVPRVEDCAGLAAAAASTSDPHIELVGTLRAGQEITLKLSGFGPSGPRERAISFRTLDEAPDRHDRMRQTVTTVVDAQRNETIRVVAPGDLELLGQCIEIIGYGGSPVPGLTYAVLER